jgi:hypothetical protein
MCLNKYCTVLMNLSLNLYLYQCFNIGYSMTVTMILKLVHTLLYPSISYCAHVKKYNNISRSFNIAYSMTVTMILKLVHNLLYPSISYCAHVKKKCWQLGACAPVKL